MLLAGRRFRIERHFLEDLGRQSVDKRLARLGAALLVCHAPRDEVVSIDHAREIFVKAHHPKSFLSLDTADHLLTRREDSLYVARVLGAWISRYI